MNMIDPAMRKSVGASSPDMLEARNVSRSFGGVKAVNNVSLSIQAGQIHGLIGPNGSGKTTMLNLISGYYMIDEGAAVLGGDNISRLDVRARARAGIARTFQKPRLLPSLSVLDNVMLGGWGAVQSGFVETALHMPRPKREERQMRERAQALLDASGLGHLSERRCEHLEHAERRFLEIVRALMIRPKLLLLDEPAGGLTGREIEYLGQIIQSVAQAGIGVLLVEHHTDFVFRLSHHVTVLNLGAVLAEGAPDMVRNDAEVVRVYLGS
ncbi:branched-chain amino acid transport system ATP-binding protein [Ochrobactrum sp. 19YEA23]|uniref:ABC transporter ATP-binding protein n=1 Tax=Ochrobactrum sp. 19YEA23 TaxID=3039854 RepID=UPI002478DA17|nr:branched-chain amino acid transport system ATP-binding protein [Ochrobactrum sp. 19YEA23]